MKVLWMVPKWTLPTVDGARVATATLIKNSVKAGMSVDVLCLSDKKEDFSELMKKEWGIHEVYTVHRNLPEQSKLKVLYYIKSFLRRPLMPLTFSSFLEDHVLEKTRDVVSKNNYDYVVLEGLHLGMPIYFQNFDFNSKIIYRAHNIESDLWFHAAKSKKNILKKILLYFQAGLVRKVEEKIISKCTGVAAISQEDLQVLKTHGASNLALIPLGLNFNHLLPKAKDQSTLKYLFIGRLDWPPNKDGLKWLLDEVWPHVMKLRSDVVLKIVGSGHSAWLGPYLNHPGVEFAGFVPSIEEAYEDCSFTLVPVFYGSGTRIKVLESFTKGRKLISTQMGVQGADLSEEDYIRAETAQDWIHTLSTLTMDSKIEEEVSRSVLKMASKFGEKELADKFYCWAKTL